MFEGLKKEWRILRENPPGSRFQARHRYRKFESPSPAWKKILVIALGFALIPVGMALWVLPGPGWLTIIAGLALLAGYWEWTSRFLDGAEIWVRRTVARISTMMKKPSCRMMAMIFAAATLACLFPLAGCSDSTEPDPVEEPTRAGSIPSDAVKVTPDTDVFPPVLHSPGFSAPVPMPGPVNTAGVEDAPVISADGATFVFFFTPDGNEPAQNQIVDGVSGIWWCGWDGLEWTEPVRARLAEPGELHLDGSFALQADTLWFGSIRAGTYRDIDIFTAVRSGDQWVDWQNAGARLNADLGVGELYPTSDGDTIYFGRVEGGFGQNDLWLTVRAGQSWSDPVNVGAPVNTSADESRPVISPDGRELWFTRLSSSLGYRGPSVFRSIRTGGAWGAPEEIVSNYCGDPGIDAAGNLYFTHLFYDADENKIEADIYVAYRNQGRPPGRPGSGGCNAH